MKPHFLNLINALVLIALGGWGYFEKGSPTALIPVFIGGYLWLQTPKLREQDKTAGHIVAALTFLTILGLFMPFRRELALGDTMGVLRSSTMLFSSILALGSFVQSFMNARKMA
jgi:uncharacterized membrane protein (UPF0136 family)